jgi:hypothetical protein
MGLIHGPGKYAQFGYKGSGQDTYDEAFKTNAAMWAHTLKEMKAKGLPTDLKSVIAYQEKSYAPVGADNDPDNLNANKVSNMDRLLAEAGGIFNKPIVQPASAATPTPRPTASPNPFDPTPMPTATPKPTPAPTAGHSPHDLTGQRLPNQATLLDTAFDTTEIPFLALNAMFRDSMLGQHGSTMDLLNLIGTGKINEAARRYNFTSPEQLKLEASKGDPFASWLLNHPTTAGILQGVTEFANPAQYAIGGAVGKPFEFGWKLLKATPNGRAIASFFSPFRNVAIAGGEEGKRAMQSLAVRVAAAPARAQEASLRVFGKLSPQEQEDVVHIYQGQLQAVKTKDPKRLGIMFARARYLDDFVDDISQQKVKAGLLDHATAEAQKKFFPMGGAFEHPAGKTAEDVVNQWLSGTGEAGSRKFTRGTERTQAQYDTLHEAQQGAKVPLKADFSPAVQIEKWASSSLQRLDLEDALKSVPKSLVQKEPKGYTYETAPRDLSGDKPGTHSTMVPWEDAVKKYPSLGDVDSPTLKKSIVSESFAKWMSDNRTRLYNPSLQYLPGTSVWSKMGNAGLHAFDRLNEMQRRAILVNPLIHPLFNLSQNALAAGVPMREVAGLVTKSVVNTFGGGKALDRFLPQSKAYTKAVEDAMRAGALAEMKRGDTRILASRFRDLSPAQWPKKLLDEAGAWNSRATFGKYGEQAFATTMFRHLRSQGIEEKEAGALVREALGNYQNVSHTGFEGGLNRVLFFYPWLKGNLPYWVRTMGTRPANVAAPHQAARANNLLVNDPSESDPKHPQYAKDFQWVIGDKEHGFQTLTPILPQRMVADATGLVAADPSTIVGNAVKIAYSRAVPGVKVAADLVETQMRPAASTLDPRNYWAMYDKKAPRDEQWKSVAANIVGELLPIPVVQNSVNKALRQGFSAAEVERDIRDRGIGMFSYDRMTKKQETALTHARGTFTYRVNNLAPGMDDGEKQRRITNLYGKYAARVKKILTGSTDDKALDKDPATNIFDTSISP